MNSRERILNSIEGHSTGKVPVDLGGTSVTGISAMACNRLKAKMKIPSPTRVFDVVQQLAMVDEEIIGLFRVDVLDISRIFLDDLDWYETILGDGSKAYFPEWFEPERHEDGSLVAKDPYGKEISRMPAGGMCFDQTFYPWADGYPDDMNLISRAFESINWFAHSHSNYLNIPEDEFRSRTRKLREESDKAITMSGGSKLLETGFFLRRMDNFLMDMYTDPGNVHRLLDKLLEVQMAGLEKKIRAAGDLVDVVRIGDDLGTTGGPLIDPGLFREFLQPRYKVLCDFIKKRTEWKVFFHSCGSIKSFIPGLIEAGVDIINPLQTNALDMDPGTLKTEFGRDICFWGGGIDTASVLPRGSKEEIRSAVLRNCEVLSKDGGFVFAPVHNILPEVPPDNIIAAYEAVKEFNGE